MYNLRHYPLQSGKADIMTGLSISQVLRVTGLGQVNLHHRVANFLAKSKGLATAVTDTGGTVLGEQLYYPFEQTRDVTGTMNTDRLYAGQPSV